MTEKQIPKKAKALEQTFFAIFYAAVLQVNI